MSLDIRALTDTMIRGVRQSLGERWSAIQDLAQPELHKLAIALDLVQQLYTSGRIDANRALRMVEMQRDAAMSVLLTAEGIGVLTARETVEAAGHSVAATVNRLAGIKLL